MFTFTIGTETYYTGTHYFINNGASRAESIDSLIFKFGITFSDCLQMIKSFNGTIEYKNYNVFSFFYFTSLEDAEKALDWINSLLLIGKLSKSK